VAAAYAVVAWVLLQLFNNVAPILELPPWVARVVLLLLVIGLPVVLFFVWMRGLASADSAAARTKTSAVDWVLAGGLVAVLAAVSYQQLALAPGARTAQQASVANDPTGTGGISVAVLPFVNLSDDRAQEFFSDGMTEEITSALAKIPNLQVVARTSAFEFKGQNRNIQAIGQALHATHVIEGSVRKEGDRVRITAQLIRADNGTHLWTESYNRQLTGVFATQEDIAQAIAIALKVPLGLPQGDTLVRNRATNLESYDDYLRARGLYRARNITEAIKLLEPALSRDPNFAPAWALLARAYNLLPNYSTVLRIDPVEQARRSIQSSQAKAEMAAREAIRLDARGVDGYSALADMRTLRGNWQEAEDLYRQALSIDPTDPDTLARYIVFLIDVGRLKESLVVAQRLHILEPFVPIYTQNVGIAMQLNGQHEASIAVLESIPPETSPQRVAALARAYATDGRYAQAADAILAVTGNRVTRRSAEEAARLMRTAPAQTSSPETLPVLEGELGAVYPFVGALDRVMEFPERAAEINFMGQVAISPLWFPAHAPLRKTERFKTLVRKMGLVDHWRERGWPDLCRPTTGDDFACD
jgi:TolB-like protein/Tfp pilus assembly protein PilF